MVAEEAGEQQAQASVVEAPALPPGCEDLGHEYNSTARGAGDTDVVQGAPDTPHNTSTVLISDGAPRQEAYLRFRVDNASSATILQATLRLYAVDGSRDGPAVYATSADWDPYSLTWNSRPAPIGAPLANVGPIAFGSFVDYDVTGHVLVGGHPSGANPLGATSPQTPFIARFLPTGELQWARRLDGARGSIMGVAAMPGDAVAFSGQVRGTFTFAGTSLTNRPTWCWACWRPPPRTAGDTCMAASMVNTVAASSRTRRATW